MQPDDSEWLAHFTGPLEFTVRPVLDDEWTIVAWLWQSYRNDLATIVKGFPYADGRYTAALLDDLPSLDGAAYIAWRPHPKTGVDAPIAFAVVKGLTGSRRSIAGFWVIPVMRREGVGQRFAEQILGAHQGPWIIAFQHDNVAGGSFWRRVADESFGSGGWTEEERPVPGLPSAPPDHFIQSN